METAKVAFAPKRVLFFRAVKGNQGLVQCELVFSICANQSLCNFSVDMTNSLQYIETTKWVSTVS
jgi:hypothetical protein